MGSTKNKFIVATQREVNGFQRKLAWFQIQKQDIYFEIAGVLDGSHSSYHRDGSIWRTSPATNNRAKFVKYHYPLKHFHGWLSLGMGMLLKTACSNEPVLKNKDRKHQITFVDIDSFPSIALNIFVDLVETSHKSLLECEDMQPPPDAQLIEFQSNRLTIIVTLLGHDHNLIVCPYDGEFKGVTCKHYNRRYTASPPGGKIEYEAYLPE